MNEAGVQRRLAAWWLLVGSLAVLTFAGQAASDDEPAPDAFYQYDTFAIGVLYYAFLFVIGAAIGSGLGLREAFGLRRPDSWKRAVLIMLGAFVAMWVTAGILDAIFHAGEEQGLDPRRITGDDVPPFLVNLGLIAVIVPIVEELIYRGLGFRLLEQFGQWPAILVTALAFALAHGILEGIPVFFVIGVGLGFVRSRTGSIYPPIIMHGVFNGVQAILGAFF
jgi:membrane protease YdiL (CAAX protease family)